LQSARNLPEEELAMARFRLLAEGLQMPPPQRENAPSDDEESGQNDYRESVESGSFGISEIQNLFADL